MAITSTRPWPPHRRFAALRLLKSFLSIAGGTIAGKVTFAGKSEQKEFLFSKFPNPKFCPQNPHKDLMDGDKRFLKTIEVGKDGGLKNAVVAVRNRYRRSNSVAAEDALGGRNGIPVVDI